MDELNSKDQQSVEQRVRDNHSLHQHAQREANAMEQLRIIVMEKEKKVKALEEEIIEMRRQVSAL